MGRQVICEKKRETRGAADYVGPKHLTAQAMVFSEDDIYHHYEMLSNHHSQPSVLYIHLISRNLHFTEDYGIQCLHLQEKVRQHAAHWHATKQCKPSITQTAKVQTVHYCSMRISLGNEVFVDFHLVFQSSVYLREPLLYNSLSRCSSEVEGDQYLGMDYGLIYRM